MSKYHVIGGQYEPHYCGGFDSLHAAKLCATAHEEYWDNWGGWHTPKIYLEENTEAIVTKGWITYYDGAEIRVPTGDPYMSKVRGKWELWEP